VKTLVFAILYEQMASIIAYREIKPLTGVGDAGK
jgi:hypothetical protein